MRHNRAVLAGAMVACALLTASCANSPDSARQPSATRIRSQSPLVGAWVSVTDPEDRLIVRANDASYTVEQADGTKYAAIERDGVLTLQGAPGEVVLFYDNETKCLMRTWLGHTTTYTSQEDAPGKAAETAEYWRKVRDCQANMKIINTAAQAYFAQNKEWPDEVSDMLGPEGAGVSTPAGRKGGQLTGMPTCPFGPAGSHRYRLVAVHEDPEDPSTPVVGYVVDWRGHFPDANWQSALTHMP
jgi:hypothetical protein